MFDEYSNATPDRKSILSCGSVKQGIAEFDICVLRTYVENLKSNVVLNQGIVHSLVCSKPSDSFEDTTSSIASFKAIESFIQDNKILSEKVEKAMQERNDYQAKSLLNEQIKDEWEISQKEIEIDYKEQISELIHQNNMKDRIINEMTQINSALKLEADLANNSKYLIEVKPNPEILESHSLVEEIRCLIEDKARDMLVLESQKKILNEFIEKSQNRILVVKALLATPLNRKNNLEKKEKNEVFVQRAEAKIDELDLSAIEEKFEPVTLGEDALNQELSKYKENLESKKRRLLKISEKNLELHKINQMMLKKNEEFEQKANKLYNDYYGEDMTMEINQEYENSLCYKIQSMSLNSIVEIEVNHSNFYDSESSDNE